MDDPVVDHLKKLYPDWDESTHPIDNREYYPGPVALQAHRSKAKVKLVYGPLGTAKTTWLCWRAQAICARAAKAGLTARVIFLRDTYRNLIDSSFQLWLKWFPDGSAAGYISQSEPVNFRLNVGGRYHEIEFRYGQTEQDASKFMSTEYDAILMELPRGCVTWHTAGWRAKRSAMPWFGPSSASPVIVHR